MSTHEQVATASAPSALLLLDLPDDILVNVFWRLSFDEQQLLHSVCRRFDAVLNSNSGMYQHLRISTNMGYCVEPSNFDPALMSAFFERHSHAVKSLSFYGAGLDDEDALHSHAAWPTYALRHTPLLTAFCLRGPSNDELFARLAQCTRLVEINFALPQGSIGLSSGLAALSALPRLRHLGIHLGFVTNNAVRDISRLTQLTSLGLREVREDLRGTSRPLTSLQSLHLISIGHTEAALPLATGLTCLSLSHRNAHGMAPPPSLARCTALRILRLRCDLTLRASIRLLGSLTQMAQLTHLVLGYVCATELLPGELQLTALRHLGYFWVPGAVPCLPPGITRLSALRTIGLGRVIVQGPEAHNSPRHIELPACITALKQLSRLFIMRQDTVHILGSNNDSGEGGAGGQQRRLEVQPTGLPTMRGDSCGVVRWWVVGEEASDPPRTAEQLGVSHQQGHAAADDDDTTSTAAAASSLPPPQRPFLNTLAYLEPRLAWFA